MNKIIISVFLFTFLISCNQKEKKDYINFENYLQQNFEIPIDKNELYVIIPLNICHSCVEKTIDKLNNFAINDKVLVILTDYSKLTIENAKNKINSQLTILSDPKMKIVNKHIISGNYVVIFKTTNHKLEKFIYHPNENDEKIENIIYNNKDFLNFFNKLFF